MFCPMWPWNRASFLCCFKLCATFHSHQWIQTGVTVQKRTICVKIGHFFLSHLTLKFDGWPWKRIGHLSCATSSFVQRFIAIGEFKLQLQSRNVWFGSKWAIFVLCDIEIGRMTLKNKGASLLCYFKLRATFHSHRWIKTWVTVRKHPIWVKSAIFLSCVTLKFDGWPWKTIRHLSHAISSFVQHFIGIRNWNCNYSPEMANLGQNRRFFVPCYLEIWQMTLKNNRASLLCYFKLPASFRSHRWIQTGVTVRKWSSGVLTSVTLTFDLWPWPFAWTSLLSLVMSPENFMMTRW